MAEQEVIHHNARVGRHQFATIAAEVFAARLCGDVISLQSCHRKGARFSFAFSLRHIFALLNRRDGRRIRRRTSDAQFFQLVHQGGFAVTCRSLRETFLRRDGLTHEQLTLAHGRKQTAFFRIAFRFFHTFTIKAQETVEFHHFARSGKLMFRATHANQRGSFL